MDAEPKPTGPDVERLSVPQDLQQKLHEANQRFHEAKRELEEAMSAAEYRHEEKVKVQFDELRKIEAEVEELNGRVKEILGRNV